jgi:hypothetical protein
MVQLFTGIVAVAVALYALRGYRWVRESSLQNLFLAFTLLGIAFLVNGIVMGYAYQEHIPFDQTMGNGLILQVGFAIYYGFSIVAYGLLLYTYCRQWGSVAAAPLAPMVVFSSPPLELVIVLLLGGILLAQLLREVRPGHGVQGAVSLCFGLLMASHILILFETGDYATYFLAKGLQLAGFAVMGIVLYRLGRGR